MREDSDRAIGALTVRDGCQEVVAVVLGEVTADALGEEKPVAGRASTTDEDLSSERAEGAAKIRGTGEAARRQHHPARARISDVAGPRLRMAPVTRALRAQSR